MARIMQISSKTALIIGAGSGISGAFASRLAAQGYKVALASRNAERLQALAQSMGAVALEVDASKPLMVEAAFSKTEDLFGAPDVVLYNPSARVPGDLLSLNMDAAEHALKVTAMGALATAQCAARRMIPRGRGTILFTGATAGIKAFPRSSVFAMGKFALRGLAQSLAKELGPQGIHVVHFVIDGSVRKADRGLESFTPEAIADSYMAAVAQPPGAWSWEIELRSSDESF